MSGVSSSCKQLLHQTISRASIVYSCINNIDHDIEWIKILEFFTKISPDIGLECHSNGIILSGISHLFTTFAMVDIAKSFFSQYSLSKENNESIYCKIKSKVFYNAFISIQSPVSKANKYQSETESYSFIIHECIEITCNSRIFDSNGSFHLIKSCNLYYEHVPRILYAKHPLESDYSIRWSIPSKTILMDWIKPFNSIISNKRSLELDWYLCLDCINHTDIQFNLAIACPLEHSQPFSSFVKVQLFKNKSCNDSDMIWKFHPDVLNEFKICNPILYSISFPLIEFRHFIRFASSFEETITCHMMTFNSPIVVQFNHHNLIYKLILSTSSIPYDMSDTRSTVYSDSDSSTSTEIPPSPDRWADE